MIFEYYSNEILHYFIFFIYFFIPLYVHNFLSTELHDRIAKIDRLRKRYEILTMSMNPPEGEEEHSQTYYVIKVLQYNTPPVVIHVL